MIMRFIYFTFGLAVLLLASGCSDSGKPIWLILPNDFKGEFRIVLDSVNGVNLIERNGVWEVEIPPSGVLMVRNDRPFYRWHAEGCRYADGRIVAYQDLGTRAGTRSTGPNSSEGSTDFDGTTHRWRVK